MGGADGLGSVGVGTFLAEDCHWAEWQRESESAVGADSAVERTDVCEANLAHPLNMHRCTHILFRLRSPGDRSN